MIVVESVFPIVRGGQVLQSDIGSGALPCMARPLCLEFPGDGYHVTTRGNAR